MRLIAPSFLAGQGSALAMIGGYVLAGELYASGGDVARGAGRIRGNGCAGFMRIEAGRRADDGTVVRATDRARAAVRAIASRCLGIGWVADLLVGRSLRDQIELPDYF